jgi:transposase
MAMGRWKDTQGGFWIARQDLPSSPGHPFYERLNELLDAGGFDRFCESSCERFYAVKMGRPSVRPGVCFRMLMIGYFEKLDSERQMAWRCSDSLSLRSFLGLEPQAGMPDHSSLSRTRQRIDLETHRAVFDWVLKRLAEHELLKGRTLAVDASTMEANAALRSIVRKETGETYGEFLTGLATESGIQTPTAQELARLDRKRKGKKCGNDEWHNPHDPDAKITKMKDGRTRLAYKPEHAVDLETGAIVAAEIHLADQGDTTTLSGTLVRAAESLREVRDDDTVAADTTDLVVEEVVADKGYHSSQTLVDLEEIDLRPYISEPDRGRRRWTARDPQRQASKRAEQKAVYGNRRRQRDHRAQRLHRKRGELVERAFDHVLDAGGMRRTHLKGREKVAKRYLVQTAAFNLGLIMRQLTGFGTPRGWADGLRRLLLRWVARLGPVRRPLALSVRALWPILLSAPIPPRAARAA